MLPFPALYYVLWLFADDSSWNQLDIAIVVLSLVGIVLEEVKSGFIPINPTIIRVMRVLRIARGWILPYSTPPCTFTTGSFKRRCLVISCNLTLLNLALLYLKVSLH